MVVYGCKIMLKRTRGCLDPLLCFDTIWHHSQIGLYMVTLWVHMGAYRCVQLHITASGCTWLQMAIYMALYGCGWVYLAVYGCNNCIWLHMAIYGCSCLHVAVTVVSCVKVQGW